MAEPTTVSEMDRGRRRRSSMPLRAKGSEPPRLMKIRAIILVATAMCDSMPTAIMTGTVMSEVLPVTTLITLVRKKIATRVSNRAVGTSS